MAKTVAVDIVKIDKVLSEISGLILRLNKKPKKDVRLIKIITNIRNQIQDAVTDAKLNFEEEFDILALTWLDYPIDGLWLTLCRLINPPSVDTSLQLPVATNFGPTLHNFGNTSIKIPGSIGL